MAFETNDKMVSHPPHYQTKNGLETIDVIEAFTEDLTGIEAVCTGNVIKYVCRWPHKNGLQDLEKAMWYLHHLIEHLKNGASDTVEIFCNNQKVGEFEQRRQEVLAKLREERVRPIPDTV